MNYRTFRADGLLLLAAVLWGAAFVAQRAAMQHLQPLTFNALRFSLGVIALTPVITMRSRHRGPSAAPGTSGWTTYMGSGAVAGLILFAAATLQQAGLVHTSAGKGGFITGLYLPLVPILGLLVGHRTGLATWVGAGLTVIGLLFLSIPPGGGLGEINRGDLLVMACAVVWAVHVLFIGHIAPGRDPLKLAAAQFLVVALASGAAAAFTETASAAAIRDAVWPTLYGGLVSVGIAFTLQVVGQCEAPPSHAALVLSLETVFAGLTGWWLLGERFGHRELAGAVVMFSGMLVSQVPRLLAAGPAEHAAVRSETDPRTASHKNEPAPAASVAGGAGT